MTYKVTFHINSFHSDLAWAEERFQVAGSRKIRVKELSQEYYSNASNERLGYTATSIQPFVVVVSTRSGGGDALLNGMLRIYVAAERPGVVDHTVEVQHRRQTS